MSERENEFAVVAINNYLVDLESQGREEIALNAPFLMSNIRHKEYERYSAIIDRYVSTDDIYNHQWLLYELMGDESAVASYLRAYPLLALGDIDGWQAQIVAAVRGGHPSGCLTGFKMSYLGWLTCELEHEHLKDLACEVVSKSGEITDETRVALLDGGLDFSHRLSVDQLLLLEAVNTVALESHRLKLTPNSSINGFRLGKKGFNRWVSAAEECIAMADEKKSQSKVKCGMTLSSNAKTFNGDMWLGQATLVLVKEVHMVLEPQHGMIAKGGGITLRITSPRGKMHMFSSYSQRKCIQSQPFNTPKIRCVPLPGCLWRRCGIGGRRFPTWRPRRVKRHASALLTCWAWPSLMNW